MSKSDQLRWTVSYSLTMEGPYEFRAEEYADTREEVESLISGAYSREETPLGFYKLRPEIGAVEFLFHKTEHKDWAWL